MTLSIQTVNLQSKPLDGNSARDCGGDHHDAHRVQVLWLISTSHCAEYSSRLRSSEAVGPNLQGMRSPSRCIVLFLLACAGLDLDNVDAPQLEFSGGFNQTIVLVPTDGGSWRPRCYLAYSTILKHRMRLVRTVHGPRNLGLACIRYRALELGGTGPNEDNSAASRS
ncbi:uncharacterized protein BDW70DRAFT_126779 [Aspergillus foveolatus]|uniref:uncharacterized protein n=1 Tax=Aspergillus foveolatus TaxID=210207 RepID=UPI003CCCA86F